MVNKYENFIDLRNTIRQDLSNESGEFKMHTHHHRLDSGLPGVSNVAVHVSRAWLTSSLEGNKSESAKVFDYVMCSSY